MSRLLRLGTRGSALALWQTNHVRDLLRSTHPYLELGTVIISTTGDRLSHPSLPEIGGKGLFTEELESALRDGAIDVAVHSLKDLPTSLPAGLALGAILARTDHADVLVSRDGFTLATLPKNASVGTGSTRRKAQLLASRPDLTILGLRGNADSRLRKARDPDGPYDAIVIAQAAMFRLGETGGISEVLSEEVMLPAPGQGAVAVECRAEAGTLALLRAINHTATEIETWAERSFLAALGGGCAVPVAARGTLDPAGWLHLRGRVNSPDGGRQVDVESRTDLGRPALHRVAGEAGRTLAEEALRKGAADLLRGSVSRNGGLAP